MFAPRWILIGMQHGLCWGQIPELRTRPWRGRKFDMRTAGTPSGTGWRQLRFEEQFGVFWENSSCTKFAYIPSPNKRHRATCI